MRSPGMRLRRTPTVAGIVRDPAILIRRTIPREVAVMPRMMASNSPRIRQIEEQREILLRASGAARGAKGALGAEPGEAAVSGSAVRGAKGAPRGTPPAVAARAGALYCLEFKVQKKGPGQCAVPLWGARVAGRLQAWSKTCRS